MCLPCRDRRAGVLDADRGIAGRLHDHFDIAGRRLGRVGGEGGRRDPLGVPADGAAGLARALRIEIDDHGHFEPRRVRHLRQEHRAEFAGADQRDADGFAGGAAGVEEVMRGSWEVIRIRLVSDAGTRLSRMAGIPDHRTRLRLSGASTFDARASPGHDECVTSVYSAAWRCARASRSSASSSTVWIGVKSRWAIYSGRVGVRM